MVKENHARSVGNDSTDVYNISMTYEGLINHAQMPEIYDLEQKVSENKSDAQISVPLSVCVETIEVAFQACKGEYYGRHENPFSRDIVYTWENLVVKDRGQYVIVVTTVENWENVIGVCQNP